VTAYIFLAIGGLWLGIAILVYRVGLGVYWVGMNAERVGRIISSALPAILFGWIAPIAFGVWLLWRRKISN
jgi:hypothetical protein